MAFSTRGMLVFEEKAEGMCDFYHLAWNGKDFFSIFAVERRRRCRGIQNETTE